MDITRFSTKLFPCFSVNSETASKIHPPRQSYIELLRIIAMFLIVFCHYFLHHNTVPITTINTNVVLTQFI